MGFSSSGMIQRTIVKYYRDSKGRNLTRALEVREAPVEGGSLE